MKARCGCDRHEVLIADEETVYYKKKWWTLRCLIKQTGKISRLIDKVVFLEKKVKECRKMRAKFVAMKGLLKRSACSYCGYTLGNRFVLKNDELICGGCNVKNGNVSGK